MKDLPFLVKPRQDIRDVGNEDVGIIRFPVFRSLALDERIAVREVDQSDALFKATADVVIAIVNRQAPDPLPEGYDRQQEITSTYAAVTRILASLGGATVALAPSEAVISVLFAEELRNLHRQSTANEEAKIVRACTALINSRLEGYEDWSDANTRKLPEDLISAIFSFYQSELSHAAEPMDLEQQQKALEAALGELRPDDGSRPPNPTGKGSTGGSATRSRRRRSSDPSASPATPSATSSRRSKPPSALSDDASTSTSSPLLAC